MGILAGILALGGAVIGAIGQVKASTSAEEQALSNETQALKEAQQLAQARAMAVGDIGRAAHKTVGSARAVIGASGVKLTTGSPLAAVNQSYANAERDISRTRQQYNYEIGARQHEASQYGSQAQAERKTRWWNFAGTILSGGAQMASAF